MQSGMLCFVCMQLLCCSFNTCCFDNTMLTCQKLYLFSSAACLLNNSSSQLINMDSNLLTFSLLPLTPHLSLYPDAISPFQRSPPPHTPTSCFFHLCLLKKKKERGASHEKADSMGYSNQSGPLRRVLQESAHLRCFRMEGWQKWMKKQCEGCTITALIPSSVFPVPYHTKPFMCTWRSALSLIFNISWQVSRADIPSSARGRRKVFVFLLQLFLFSLKLSCVTNWLASQIHEVKATQRKMIVFACLFSRTGELPQRTIWN